MLLADTGPPVAGANSRDRHHQACADLLRNHPGPMLVPAPVVVEVCQLLAKAPTQKQHSWPRSEQAR